MRGIRTSPCAVLAMLTGLSGWAQTAPAAPATVQARAAAIEANTSAQASLRQNDLHGAIEAAGRALALDPGYQAAYLTRATAEQRLLDDEAAIADATQALAAARTAAERDQALTVLANYQEAAGDLTGAIAHERQRLDTARQPDGIHLRLAEFECMNQDLDTAFADANAAVSQNPANLAALRERALIERLRHNDDAAHADLATLAERQAGVLRNAPPPTPPPGAAPLPPIPPPPATGTPAREAAIVWHNIGMARARHSDVPGALDAYSQAIAADASYFDGWMSRAGLAERALAYETGIADATQALQLAQTAAQRDQAYTTRATLEAAIGAIAEAMADLGKTLETSAHPETVHYRLAVTARDHGDLATALRELDAALQLNPTEATWLHARAAVERRLGKNAEAQADAAAAQQAYVIPPAPAARGGAAAGRGAGPAAAAAAPAAATAADAELSARHAALENAFRSGDYAAALQLAQQILASAPRDVEARNTAANCYLRMKDYSSAAAQFRQALGLQPGEFHNLIGLLEADFRGGLADPGRQAALDQLRGMARALTLPYGVSWYADAFTAGERTVLVQECDNLCGQFQFRYRFEVNNAQGAQELVLQLESNDFDQAAWGKAHPDLQRAGGREYTLDGYRALQPGEHLPPPGAISASQQGAQIHITYEVFDTGEPSYEQVKARVSKLVQGLRAAPGANNGMGGGTGD